MTTRRQAELALDLQFGGGLTLGGWLIRERRTGASYAAMAADLSTRIGMPVSAEAVRRWCHQEAE